MHIIQSKLLGLLEHGPITGLALREIGAKIGVKDSPQKVKHHLDQLAKKGFLRIDRKNNKIEKLGGGQIKTNMFALPIMGRANCGEATFFADNHIEEYLQVTKGILGDLAKRTNDLFVLKAVGPSMNRADINGDTIDDGDFVIVDRKNTAPKNGARVVSVVNGVANIKRLHVDEKHHQVVLMSESNQVIPPIYIDQSDLDQFLINGTVVKVMKQVQV